MLTETIIVDGLPYKVELEPDLESGGYVAEVAGLPGCITQGEDIEELLDNAADAIATYLQAMDDLRKRGVSASD